MNLEISKLVTHSGNVDRMCLLGLQYLGRENDAHVAQVDIDGPQVLPVPGAARQHGDLGQVLQCLPLPSTEIDINLGVTATQYKTS